MRLTMWVFRTIGPEPPVMRMRCCAACDAADGTRLVPCDPRDRNRMLPACGCARGAGERCDTDGCRFAVKRIPNPVHGGPR